MKDDTKSLGVSWAITGIAVVSAALAVAHEAPEPKQRPLAAVVTSAPAPTPSVSVSTVYTTTTVTVTPTPTLKPKKTTATKKAVVEPEPTEDPVDEPEGAYYANCSAARAAGAAPVYEGSPGYRPGLDRDGDGVGCE